jgi:hypothetical protein
LLELIIIICFGKVLQYWCSVHWSIYENCTKMFVFLMAVWFLENNTNWYLKLKYLKPYIFDFYRNAYTEIEFVACNCEDYHNKCISLIIFEWLIKLYCLDQCLDQSFIQYQDASMWLEYKAPIGCWAYELLMSLRKDEWTTFISWPNFDSRGTKKPFVPGKY